MYILLARPCDDNGMFLPPGSLPKPLSDKSSSDWTPYRNHVEFETAEYLFTENQTPAGQINKLLDLWASTLKKHDDKPPFADFRNLYKTIDRTPLGDVKWQSFSVRYNGEKPDTDAPPWMDQVFDVWYRDPREVIHNMLANPDYAKEFDYRPYREFSTDDDERQWKDFMSGDWAWDQADIISEDPESHGSTFVPVVLGSDKTTVSVATGNNEYYPLYASIGNVCNNEHATSDVKFRKFRRQLFHCSLSKILETLRPGITKYEVARFGDRHFRRVIYGLGPYIADYEEQVLLTCIVRGWCPRCLSSRINLDEPADVLVEEGTLDALWDEYGIVADIHELIAPDILHQLIKGTFKDHLVDWIKKYLYQTHSKKDAERIIDDIDRRIAAVPAFAGLRRFPQGRGFKQWTGDDLKALMKVYLSAIEGYVPVDMVRTFRAFLEFCYLVRRSIITEKTLEQIQEALDRFHRHRQIFETLDVISTFSLPRQHSLQHYIHLIRLFGAPNGLCSSITEAKHIKAVKEPWRRSSRYEALGQMLVTNQCLDKLAASRADFTQRKMLNVDNDNDKNNEVDDGPTNVEARVELAKTPQYKCACTIAALAIELSIPHLSNLLRHFLFGQLNRNDPRDPSEVPLAYCPQFDNKISVFNSACLRFFAPSDLSGIGGMRREYIRACPIWRNEHPRFDCVFVNTNPGLDGMRGMDVARVLTFFSFTYKRKLYSCAVVRWFDTIGDSPNEDTGMWVVQPAHNNNNTPHISVIHIDSIYRAAHLIPVYGTRVIPAQHHHHQTYDIFHHFYVNKYADHHSFEIAF
ncbi:uncharacterized protein F5891DRAFT_1131624 [Suillus fuscotomentosus]|uniref:Uncharacterized protein n=1 Tax=Suillus fuscotomentosus TaxID=1912939 RepID=A0AAD4DT19_9AGAM|nr:uncharacterized protein F5891DRAFT_1131624 [Suillus fuscotomentosus]KAG1890648.1 hypothetical protein F5891DRAFT_1131624 [Suillus fuscotomentosus]